MGKRVPSGVIINDIIRRKHSIILNIRVRWDSCGSVRRNSTESSFLSTSDSSDSDDETFVINIDKRSFTFEATTKLRPSEIFFSKTQIECDPYKLEKDIKRICTGKYRFGENWIGVYESDGKYCAINNELLWKLRVAEKFQECFHVEAKLVAIPKCTNYPYYSDELHIDSEMSQVFFTFRKTIQKLPTNETLRVDPSEIRISVKVKMDMDTSMLKYFTTNGSLTVRIRRSHTFSDETETFLDFLQKDDDHK